MRYFADEFQQEHLGIYYYVEIRSYGMFEARATTYPALGCCKYVALGNYLLGVQPLCT